MQKKILAVAISALAAFPAFADNGPSVTLYGVADVGMRFGDYGDGNRTQVESGQGFGSRIGVKGEQGVPDLDMKGIFQIEGGIDLQRGANTQGGLPWGRQAFAGLTGDFGTVTFGRQYSPSFIVMDSVDAFDTGFGGTIANTEGNVGGSFVSRLDNFAQYVTPNLSGFTGKLGYTSSAKGLTGAENGAASSAANNNEVGQGWTGSVEFAQGPFYAGVAFFDAKVGKTNTNNDTAKYFIGGATYNLEVAKLFASYSKGSTDTSGTKTADGNGWGLGATIPAGNHNTVVVQYSHYTDKLNSNNNCGDAAIGDEYQAAKSLMLYAMAARMNNSTTGTCTPGGAASNDLPSAAGFAARNLMLGLVYRF